jgi:GNAT superfamily N-acetyltransferase
MTIEVTRVSAEDVTPLRELHRRSMNCQIMHDSFLRRGFSDPYLIRADGRLAGYGLVANRHWPETVHEFFSLPAYEPQALSMFRRLLEESRASHVLAQTNDRLQLLMLYDCATNVVSDTILFEDSFVSALPCPAGEFRKVTEEDKKRIEERKLDSGAGWMIECDGAPIATGGVLFHYNPPFGDLYMEVREEHRRRGVGSYLVQELKRVCYEMGKTPAARCNVSNVASRKTMEKAGLRPCARLLVGDVAK